MAVCTESSAANSELTRAEPLHTAEICTSVAFEFVSVCASLRRPTAAQRETRGAWSANRTVEVWIEGPTQRTAPETCEVSLLLWQLVLQFVREVLNRSLLRHLLKFRIGLG